MLLKQLVFKLSNIERRNHIYSTAKRGKKKSDLVNENIKLFYDKNIKKNRKMIINEYMIAVEEKLILKAEDDWRGFGGALEIESFGTWTL